MPNPFHEPQIRILKEAFPDIDILTIDEALYSARGDINTAFDMLLEPNSPTKSTHSSETTLFSPINKTKSPTVREELAQWRQELYVESRLKAERDMNRKTNNGSFLSLPRRIKNNPFIHHSDGHSNNDRNRVHRLENTVKYQSQSVHQYTSQNLNTNHHNQGYPNIVFTTSIRSTPNRSTLPPPVPPRRLTVGEVRTNPFLSELPNNSNSSPQLLVNTPPPSRRLNTITHHQRAIDEGAVNNPFDEPDMPPPAYQDIQKDTLVHLTP
ncbi:hypothetical protein BCV72DRAFT_306397 [Rhizopus microsporus var. microsporus]|uniref:CUE domain-containing protein n=1 Tax=Rhizopus microsporus var. microsporus TaxID=86635 RepID=A0A1X0R0E0_RHIZD|nr:hypothetical protein BCV72DRAFT_306397 [Rhizopus microsporus var. microsporus]